MNLTSGLEQVPLLLWPVTATSAILAIGFGTRYLRRIREQSPFGQYVSQIRSFMQSLDEDRPRLTGDRETLANADLNEEDMTVTPQQFRKLYSSFIGTYT